jgi:hypothetical protein
MRHAGNVSLLVSFEVGLSLDKSHKNKAKARKKMKYRLMSDSVYQIFPKAKVNQVCSRLIKVVPR